MKFKYSFLAAILATISLHSRFALADEFNLKYQHVPNQLIVKFKQSMNSAPVTDLINSLDAKTVNSFRASGAVVLEFAEKDADLYAKAIKLKSSPDVAYVEANTILHMDATVPNDPSFNQLYGMHNPGSRTAVADADIDAPEAWDIQKGSKNVLIGIIDTGIDCSHPDLKANCWTNPGESGLDARGRDKKTNGVDDDKNGYVDDWHGWDFVNKDNDPLDDNRHGTHVAGTIGAAGDNGVGVVGVNWQVSMMGLKFLSGDGSGTLEDAVLAIEYATKMGVTLSSNSWGGGGFSQTMFDAIKEANKKGILFTAAAGNDGVDNDAQPHYPASYALPNIVSVAATDDKDGLAAFSCYGQKSVHVAAPGVDILSTTPGGKYEKLSGTSMATPHVSGVIGLMKAAFPNLTGAELKDRLLKTADPITSIQSNTITGGRINAYNAVEADQVAPAAVPDLAVSQASSSSITLGWNGVGDDGMTGKASRYEARISGQPILTEDDWNSATPVKLISNQKLTDGRLQGEISNLPFNSSGFVAVRGLDNVGNAGGLSESTPFELIKVKVVAENKGNSMDGLTGDGAWNVANIPGGDGTAFTDSPDGDYKTNTNVSLVFPLMDATTTDFTLAFQHRYEIETNYDFGFVEVWTDNGKNWTPVKKFTGTNQNWQNETLSLKQYLSGATQFKVRFRLQTDYAVGADGWAVDNVQFIAPAE